MREALQGKKYAPHLKRIKPLVAPTLRRIRARGTAGKQPRYISPTTLCGISAFPRKHMLDALAGKRRRLPSRSS